MEERRVVVMLVHQSLKYVVYTLEFTVLHHWSGSTLQSPVSGPFYGGNRQYSSVIVVSLTLLLL